MARATESIPVHQATNGDAHTRLRVPLEGYGTHFGELALGARRNGAEYTAEDRASVEEIGALARAIALAEAMNGVRA